MAKSASQTHGAQTQWAAKTCAVRHSYSYRYRYIYTLSLG